MRAIRIGMVGGGFMARTYSFALAAVHGLAWPDVPAVETVIPGDTYALGCSLGCSSGMACCNPALTLGQIRQSGVLGSGHGR